MDAIEAIEATGEEAVAEQVEAVLGRLVGDFAGTAGVVLTALGLRLGLRLGLWDALAAEPALPETVAEQAGAAVPYVREWLRSQAAAAYVVHHPALAAHLRDALHTGTTCSYHPAHPIDWQQ